MFYLLFIRKMKNMRKLLPLVVLTTFMMACMLNERNGYSFDTAYMRSRTLSQMNTLNIFQNELNNGNNTYVRYYFLNKYADKIRAYYLEADSILRVLY